jgi:hypothetical protein
MAAGDEAATQPAQSSLALAADRVRESAKWLIVSFAAVGATLMAGLQLTNIGGLTNSGPDERLSWAIFGIVLGVGGVVVAIGAASAVVTASFVTLKVLTEESPTDAARASIEGDKIVMGGYDTVEDLRDAFAVAVRARIDALRDSYEDPSDSNSARAETAKAWAVTLGQVVSQVLERASFARVQNSYWWARWGILFGAALAATGIAMFAWAANPPKGVTAPVVAKTPTEVSVNIRQPHRSALARKLGSQCDLTNVDAFALSAVGEVYQVASVPTDKCKAALFNVGPRVGRVVLKTATAKG